MPSTARRPRALGTLSFALALSLAAAGCGGGGGDSGGGPAAAAPSGGNATASGLAATAFKDLQDAYQFAAVVAPDLPTTGGPQGVAVGLSKWRVDGQRIGRDDYAFDGRGWRAVPRDPLWLLGVGGWRSSKGFPTEGRWTVLPDGTLEIANPDWDGLSARIERIESHLASRQGYPSPAWTLEDGATPRLVDFAMPERNATRVLRWRFPVDVHSVDPDHALDGAQVAGFDELVAEFRSGRACVVRIVGDETLFNAWLYVAPDGSVHVNDAMAPAVRRSGRELTAPPPPGSLADWRPTPTCETAGGYPRAVAVTRRVVAGQEVVVLDGVPHDVLKALGCYEIAPTGALPWTGRPMCRMILASVDGRLRPGLLRSKDTAFVEATEHSPGSERIRVFNAFDRIGIDTHTSQLGLPPAP